MVVPHVGTWIEIPQTHIWLDESERRSPRGNVD